LKRNSVEAPVEVSLIFFTGYIIPKHFARFFHIFAGKRVDKIHRKSINYKNSKGR